MTGQSLAHRRRHHRGLHHARVTGPSPGSAPTAPRRASSDDASQRRIDLPTLEQLVADGEIDTVLVVFPDLQGRLMGKRVAGRFFLDTSSDASGRERAGTARSRRATTCSPSTST